MTITGERREPPRAAGPGVTRFVPRAGHRLSYESSGAGAVAVLGLHDLLADRGQLRPLAAALAGDGFRVTLPDARGHGASSAISGREYPERELAADALAILDAEGVSSVHVVAMGWGVGTGLELAAAAPERVASLVLVEPYVPSVLAQWRNEGMGTVPAACGGAGVRHRPTAAAGDALRHLEAMRAAAAAAAKGQIDRALDLYLGARLGAAWRGQMPRPRLAAARRAAANLGPLLTSAINGPVEARVLATMTGPMTLLLRQDAPTHTVTTAEILAESVPRTHESNGCPQMPVNRQILARSGSRCFRGCSWRDEHGNLNVVARLAGG